MEKTDPTGRLIRFGVFEVDPRAGELRKNGVKIKLQEQPFQILAMLLERPGETVTREELQQKLWSNDTFVDFDNSLNKAVNKIREAVGDSADNPRFVETMARRGYRFIAPVNGSSTAEEIPEAPATATRSRRRWLFAVAIGVGVAVVIASVGLTSWLMKSSSPAPKHVLTRLTSDTGLTTDPALSPDGKLLAYASDRSGEGNLDIWVRHVGGGEPIRLTTDQADESQPSFSPDGGKIVFRSEIGEGGLYVMPALGGKPRLIATKGRDPRFSPDGDFIAYWDNGWRGTEPLIVPGITNKMYVVPFSGGAPRQVRPDFDVARFPLWTPDGKNLLFWGSREPTILGDSEKEDWWVTPLEGGAAVKTNAFDAFRKAGLPHDAAPSCWAVDGIHLVFSAWLGDASNLWQVPLSPKSWQVTGPPQQLTFGTGLESQPSIAADGRLVFSSGSHNSDIWSLPVDANQGKVGGKIQRITQNGAFNRFFDLTADGKKLVFLSNRTGNWDVWLKDMQSGNESPLTMTPGDEHFPRMSADGSKISYEEIGENNKRSIYQIPPGESVPQLLCEDCGGPWHWSSNGKWFLYRVIKRPESIGLLNLATGKKTELIKHAQYPVYLAYFSPDDCWVTFGAEIGIGHNCLFIAPFRGESPPTEGEWIPVTDGKHFDFKSRWSPNGNLLYFISTRDGFRCIWAQALDPQTKRSVGSPFEVYPSHSARLSLSHLEEFSVGHDKIVFSLGESTGNIWMTTLKQ